MAGIGIRAGLFRPRAQGLGFIGPIIGFWACGRAFRPVSAVTLASLCPWQLVRLLAAR